MVALSGDHGKPRPALIVQSDLVEGSDTVLVCYFSSDLVEPGPRRLSVDPTPENGLRKPSQLMVEKIFAARRDRFGPVIGTLDRNTLARLGGAIAFVTGLLDDQVATAG